MDAIKAGAIGNLRIIRTSFCYRTTRIAGNIRFDPKLYGGALMDIGCYCVNFSRYFAGGEPTSISATGKLHETGVDEMAVGAMRFGGQNAGDANAGGAADEILASFTFGMSVQADNTAYLCGDEGYIEIPVPWKPSAGTASFVVTRGAPPKMDNGPAVAGPPPRDVRTVAVNADVYGIEADDFAATVLDGKSPTISRADSVGNMRVIEQMRGQIYHR
jgi:predicted dehydrogenase